MDIHVIAPLASPAERAAVDALLGPATSGWAGGIRDSSGEGHSAHGGHAARAERDLLLPALHAVQDRIGWISQPALSYICRRLSVPPAEAYGVATFYALLTTRERAPVVAHVCDDIACRLAGAEELCADLARTQGPAGEASPDGSTTWLRSPCLGLCERAPAALFTVAGPDPEQLAVAPIDAVGVAARLAEAAAGRSIGSGSEAEKAADRLAAARASVPQAGQDGLRLLARVGRVDPGSIDAYRAAGGYAALSRALELGPEGVIAEVTAARLLGRGGAAFPTGRKWAAVRAAMGTPKYVVCNADESEPGTFKDRALLEGDPFVVIEAMTIEAFATGAGRGFIYLRGEYPLAAARLARRHRQARAGGWLGPDIAGLGLRLRHRAPDRRRRLHLRRGDRPVQLDRGQAGRAAQQAAVPGRGRPVRQADRRQQRRDAGQCSADPAGRREAYAAIGTEGSAGPKLFCVSGHVARPGIYEVPFGTTLRELLTLAGGASGEIRTILLGGAAGVFVGPEALDTPLTFEGTRAINATLGSGS